MYLMNLVTRYSVDLDKYTITIEINCYAVMMMMIDQQYKSNQ